MKWMQTAALVIIAVGVLGLAYAGIQYFQQSPDVKVGDMEVDVRDRRTSDFPIWLGVGCILVGGGAYVFSTRNERNL